MFPNPSKQQGFSLIELMIAATLGIVLTGAAIQFMVSSNQSYNIHDNLSRVQENGRIAMDILAKDIRKAGYQEDLVGKKPHVVLVDCTHESNGNTMPCAADLGGNVSDTLPVQYSTSNTISTDCLGRSVTDVAGGQIGDIIANIYYIQNNGGPDDGINTLYCYGFNVTRGLEIQPDLGPQPLIDGIDRMQVLYRVQSGSSYEYKSFDRLTTMEQENITAIRVGLLVSNGQDKTKGRASPQSRQYRVLDSTIWTVDGDTQLRRIYSTTVQLNNRHAGASG